MITAGIDAGNKTTKTVILKNGEIIARALKPSGFDQEKAAREAFNEALRLANLDVADLAYTVVTGAGKHVISFAEGHLTEVSAAARGVNKLFPEARTVIDVGEEEGFALKIDKEGKVVDFAINEKCAAGTGSFLESMSRALETTVEEIGQLSLRGKKTVPMNAQCVVFAESEVISLIHAPVAKEDIAKSIHVAMASRISALVRRIGLEKEVVIIGGVAHNPGFVRALEEDLGVEILIPAYPDYISALGAALAAGEKAGV